MLEEKWGLHFAAPVVVCTETGRLQSLATLSVLHLLKIRYLTLALIFVLCLGNLLPDSGWF